MTDAAQSEDGTGKLGMRVAKLVIMVVALVTLAVLGQMAMEDQAATIDQPDGLDRPGAVDAEDVNSTAVVDTATLGTAPADRASKERT